MTKYSLLLVLLFNVSCATTHMQSTSNETEPFLGFSGFDKIYTGADPDQISNSKRFTSSIGKYAEPIPFRFKTFVYLNNSGIDNTVAECGTSLGTHAKTPMDFQSLKEPFENIALMQIRNSGAEVRESGYMLFSIVWEITDVPMSLTKHAPTNFCLVRTTMEIGEKFIDENSSFLKTIPSLPPQKSDPLFTQELTYFVSKDRLREVMEIELKENLAIALPTLTGKSIDQCALFQADPVGECTRVYSREILIQEEALRCATEKHEEGEIVSEISRLENRLKSMSSERDTKRQYYVEKQCQ